MSQSLANIVVHLVFSTKGRHQLLREEERDQLHAYITGVLKNHDSPLIQVNSVRDHVHILFAQSKNHAPAKIVEQVKTASSAWIGCMADSLGTATEFIIRRRTNLAPFD